MRPLGLVALLLVACETYQFETTECASLERARGGDNDPPWRTDEGDAGGPRFVSASVEWLALGETPCRFDLRLSAAVVEGDRELTAADVARMTMFAAGDFDPSPPYIFVVNGDAAFDRSGDFTNVVATACAADIEGLESRRTALYLKLVDADGRESDAFCARTFAKAGVALPNADGSNDNGA